MGGGYYMSLINVSLPNERISELELDVVANFAASASLEIVEEELDYYYLSKVKHAQLVINSIDLKQLHTDKTHKLLKHHLFNSQELNTLITKIEKRINREIERSILKNSCLYDRDCMPKFDLEAFIEGTEENLRTLNLTNMLAKTIDIVWKKSSKELLPKALLKLTSNFKASGFIMSLGGVSPSSMEHQLKEKVYKIIIGMLKHEKLELCKLLRHGLISAFYRSEDIIEPATILREIRTA